MRKFLSNCAGRSESIQGNGLLLLIHFWLPVALGWSVSVVIQRAGGGSFSHEGLSLLLAGIGAAYSFDRLFDSSVTALPPWLLLMLGVAFTLCAGTIIFLLVEGKTDPASLGVLAVLSWVSILYRRLKRIPLAKTAAVAISWIWACSTLPLSGGEPHALILDVTFPLVLLISAGCILCDLKDMNEDRQARIPTLPVLLGTAPSCLVATGMAFLAAALAFLHHRFGITVGAILLAVAAQFPTILAMKSLGPIMVDSILTIPGILIASGIV